MNPPDATPVTNGALTSQHGRERDGRHPLRDRVQLTTQADTEVLRRADLAFFDALLDSDIPALEALLAEEFLIVDVASGAVYPR